MFILHTHTHTQKNLEDRDSESKDTAKPSGVDCVFSLCFSLVSSWKELVFICPFGT